MLLENRIMPFTLLFTDSSFEDINFMKKYLKVVDTILGIDGGTDILYKNKIMPDLIIGDMDSIDEKILDFFKKETKIAIYPSKKDETDTELGINWCIQNHKKNVIIFNSMQKRLDHIQGLIANLIYAHKNGINLEIVNQNQKIFISRNTSFKIKKGVNISLIPLTEIVEKVSTEGLEYPLKKENLYFYRSRGISNVALENEVKITHKKGLLMIIISEKDVV